MRSYRAPPARRTVFGPCSRLVVASSRAWFVLGFAVSAWFLSYPTGQASAQECADDTARLRTAEPIHLKSFSFEPGILAHIDGDTDLDLVVPTHNPPALAILYGGAGTSFSAPRFVDVSEGKPTEVAVGDWDSDQRPDLAALDPESGLVHTWFAQADGGFLESDAALDMGADPRRLRAVDLTNDGAPELVAIDGETRLLRIRINDNGSFHRFADLPTEHRVIDYAFSPLDEEPGVDLAILSRDGARIEIYSGDDAGEFVRLRFYLVQGEADRLSLLFPPDADVADLVVATKDGIQVFRNDGAGELSASPLIAAPAAGPDRKVHCADITGDGNPDVVTVKRALTAADLESFSPGTLLPRLGARLTDKEVNLAVGDLDGDGASDVVAFFPRPGVLHVLRSHSIDVRSDCNANGREDACELDGDPALDCDGDFELDECAIARGDASDCNDNAIVDDCELLRPVALSDEDGVETPDDPERIATADLDRDGDLDLVTTSRGHGNIAILLQIGNRSFAPARFVFRDRRTDFGGVCAGDVVGDDLPDIVALDSNGRQIRIFENEGELRFTEVDAIPLRNAPTDALLEDLDADGTLDLIVAEGGTDRFPNDRVSVFVNVDKVEFVDELELAVGSFPDTLLFADVIGDPRKDIVTLDRRSGTLSILRRLEDVQFAEAVSIAVPGEPAHAVLGHFNNDDRIDLAVASQSPPAVSIFFGNPEGSLTLDDEIGLGVPARHIATLDLDDDRDLDLAVSTGDEGLLSSLTNRGDGRFDVAVPETPLAHGEASADRMLVADIDADDHDDLVVVSKSSSSVWLHLDAALALHASDARYVPIGPTDVVAMVVGDFDGDDADDVVLYRTLCDTLEFFRGDGDEDVERSTALWPISDGSVDGTHAESLDWNGDGSLDIVVAHPAGEEILIAINAGDGRFTENFRIGTSAGMHDLSIADFDGRRRADLVGAVKNDDLDGVLVALRSADGSISSEELIRTPTGESVLATHAVDLDGDGLDEIVAAVQDDTLNGSPLGGGSLLVYRNLANGEFDLGARIATGRSPVDVASGDVDGDGRLDLVSINEQGSSASIAFGPIPLDLEDDEIVTTTQHFVSILPKSLALAQIDGYPGLEIVSAGATLDETIVLRHVDGNFERTSFGSDSRRTSAAIDIDGDGFDEILQIGKGSALQVRHNLTERDPPNDGDRDGIPDSCRHPVFRRGDVNDSEIVDLSDPVALLTYLFLGGPEPDCRDAADANDDEKLELTDAIFLLSFLFQGGPPPPPPGPHHCGVDPIRPDSQILDCAEYDTCP